MKAHEQEKFNSTEARRGGMNDLEEVERLLMRRISSS
jgi:hypothetical protein